MLGAILSVLLVLTCLAMIGLILIQRGKGGGLAGAFGGGGVEQAFGTHAATMAQKATAVLAGIFLVLSILLGIEYGGSKRVSSPLTAPVAPAPAAPTAPTVPATPAAPEAK